MGWGVVVLSCVCGVWGVVGLWRFPGTNQGTVYIGIGISMMAMRKADEVCIVLGILSGVRSLWSGGGASGRLSGYGGRGRDWRYSVCS